jgi:tungstate transport system ATP-binding protein
VVIEESPVLEVEGLVVRRGRFRLQIRRLELFQGQILAVVGPNGSGKTTLLMSLGLLLKPEEGRVKLCGKLTSGLATPLELRRKVVMVFQKPLLLNGTVLENVSLGLRLRGIRGKRSDEQALVALEKLGIAHLRRRHVKGLSGGEAQRVSLARPLAVEPEVLLLGEPFSSLDPPSKDRLLEDLDRLLHTTGTTAIMTTHDRLDAMSICDKVAVMCEGEILQMGPTSEVVHRPLHPFVGEFLDLRKTKERLTSLLASKG